MKALIGLLCLLASQLIYENAQADGVFAYDGNMIVFKDTPCTGAVAELIKPEFMPLFKSAAVLWRGKATAACWTGSPENNEDIYIVDETGDNGVIPRSAIKFDPKV